jgi:predicted nucleic acid-binding protein
MPSFYLETSGAFKRYRTERGSDVIDELFDDQRPNEAFFSSYLTTIEFEAIAARALKGRVLALPTYRAMLGRFAADFLAAVHVRPIDGDTQREAAGLARFYTLRAPDAIHLATARLVRQDGTTDLVYLSSDQELVDAARRDGFDVLDPEDAAALTALRAHRS